MKFIIFSASDELDNYAETLADKGFSVMLAHKEDPKGWDLDKEDVGDKEANRFFNSKKANLYSMDAMDAIMELETVENKEDYMIIVDAVLFRDVRELSDFPLFIRPEKTLNTWYDDDDEDESSGEPWNDLNGLS